MEDLTTEGTLEKNFFLVPAAAHSEGLLFYPPFSSHPLE
jgi:hypothetical protein